MVLEKTLESPLDCKEIQPVYPKGDESLVFIRGRGFSRVAAAFSSYDGDLSLPFGLALGSPIFPSGCEGTLGVALESLQGLRDLT